jgi:hypothetical protein
VWKPQGQEVRDLQKTLDDVHRPMAAEAAKDRRRGKKKQPPQPNFEVGDFMLKATVANVGRSKLQIVWKGPMRIVRTKSPRVF